MSAECPACGGNIEDDEHAYGPDYEGGADAFCHQENQHVHVLTGGS